MNVKKLILLNLPYKDCSYPDRKENPLPYVLRIRERRKATNSPSG